MGEYDLYDILAELGYGLAPRTRVDRADAFGDKNEKWLVDLPPNTGATLKALAGQFARGGTEELENPEVFNTPEVRFAGGLGALKALGKPAEILSETKEIVRSVTATRRVSLGDVLHPRRDVIHPADRPTGKAVFVGLEHIESGNGRRIGQTELDLTELTGRKPVFKKNDILYGYLRPYLNKVWVAEFDGVCSVDQYVYSVDSAADPRYLAWFMRSDIFLSRAPISQPGQLPRIRSNEVASIPLDLPPLNEQKRVAASLEKQMNTVERARAAAEARLEAATQSQIERRAATSAGIHKINLRNLDQVMVPLPDLAEQQRIASELTNCTMICAGALQFLDSEVSSIAALPAALLRRAFRGEL